MANVRDMLTDAEWELMGTDSASQTGTFTGNPSNNQTVTIDGKVYTFKTTLTGAADEVLIGANAAAQASNLADAINDNSANEGATYGTGTVAHTTVTASVNSGTITITAITAGPSSIALSETLSNFTWNGSTLVNGGYTLKSRDDHPGHFRAKFRILLNGANIDYISSDESGTKTVTRNTITMAASRVYMGRATPYDFWIIREATYEYYYFGALWIAAEWAAQEITSVTNGATTDLTFTNPHNMSNGQTVTLTGFSGDDNWLAQNGKSFSVTVVDASTITINLDSSTFAAATPGYAGNNQSITLSLLQTSGTATSTSGFRRALGCWSQNTTPSAAHWWAFNQHSVSVGTGNTFSDNGHAGCGVSIHRDQSTVGNRIGLSTGYMLFGCIVAHGISASTANPAVTGMLWNAVVYSHSSSSGVEWDLDQIPLLGRFFYNMRDPNASGLIFHGSIFIEVPEAL
jgi:hypothetical protein